MEVHYYSGHTIILYKPLYLSVSLLQVACQVVTAVLHYLFLAVFCWMLSEGVMLYLMLVVVFSTLAKKWWFFMILGWGK